MLANSIRKWQIGYKWGKPGALWMARDHKVAGTASRGRGIRHGATKVGAKETTGRRLGYGVSLQ